MKIVIIGVGAVGTSIAIAAAIRNIIREIVLIDTDTDRIRGISADMAYGLPLISSSIVRAGTYDDIEGAALVIIAAGINEKAGGATDRSDPLGRLRLLGTNAAIFADIVPKITTVAPLVPIMIATNPPEPLAEIARALVRHDMVLSTSTALDTMRFRVQLARRFGVRSNDVNAYVVGEHGTSSVFLWSSARIGGRLVQDLLRERNSSTAAFQREIEDEVRFANIDIIQGIGASQFGIGMISARLAEMILRDEKAVVAVGSHSAAFGATISLPSIVGRGGVSDTIWPSLSEQEESDLHGCVARLREVTSIELLKIGIESYTA